MKWEYRIDSITQYSVNRISVQFTIIKDNVDVKQQEIYVNPSTLPLTANSQTVEDAINDVVGKTCKEYINSTKMTDVAKPNLEGKKFTIVEDSLNNL